MNPKFLVNLRKFANVSWPNMRIGHSIWASDPKYPCANPDGPVDNSDCPENEPLCNCPCQELMPGEGNQWWDIWDWFEDDGKEPTDDKLKSLNEGIKECELIESQLGEEYLGCLWNDIDHPSSCDCPCRGEKFNEYIEYTRTHATFWNTPKNTPLWRNAQMQLITAQKASIVVNGDFSIKPGIVINILDNEPEQDGEPKRHSGNWLVIGTEHVINGASMHRTIITLSRDSSPVDPNTGEAGFFSGLWDSIFDQDT